MPELSAPEWVLLRTAPDQLTADIWLGLLEGENITAMLAPEDAVSFLGVSVKPCRLLVPRDRLMAAGAALNSQIGTCGRPPETADQPN